MNVLHLGDCLDVLQREVASESVDLIYIDPPFNSKRNYNIFFDDKDIKTQRIAFEDTWSLKNIQDSLNELRTLRTEKIYKLLMIYSDIAPFTFSYLVMMALRIIELHRVLKPTGSFYLHCDPTMSHYLKTVCDVIFGQENFRNEISWKRTPFSGSSKSLAKQLPREHDVIFLYSKSQDMFWNAPSEPYSEEYLSRFRWKDDRGFYRKTLLKTYSEETLERLKKENRLIEPVKNGAMYSYKQYLDESKGVKLIGDIWTDINMLNPVSKERLGYPTQKPRALLERIINASSNEGDIVLDAFCGCGTTVDAAESLKRQWIGIDISPIAVSLIQKRLKESYGKSLSEYEVRGIPKDEASAIRLWQQNPFAFQDWWITEFCAFSMTFGRKGADKGVDGIALYQTDNKGNTIKAAFQVKGGKVQSKDIDALLGAMVKHNCGLGVFLSIEPLTKPMLETVAKSGVVSVPGFEYPKLQAMTLAEFFSERKLRLPQTNITFETAKLKGKGSRQIQLDSEEYI